MRNVVAIDASGLQTMEELLESCHRKNMSLLLSGVAPQPIAAMRQSGLLGRLGEENALDNIYEALSRAQAIVDLHKTNPPR
jgi:SulP family sulfate permease